jgi:hypothetical protein
MSENPSHVPEEIGQGGGIDIAGLREKGLSEVGVKYLRSILSTPDQPRTTEESVKAVILTESVRTEIGMTDRDLEVIDEFLGMNEAVSGTRHGERVEISRGSGVHDGIYREDVYTEQGEHNIWYGFPFNVKAGSLDKE